MSRYADLSLRWKIPLRVMAAVLGTALAVTVALLARDYQDARQNLEAHAKSLGRVLANTLVTPVLHDDLWRAYEILLSAREASFVNRTPPFAVSFRAKQPNTAGLGDSSCGSIRTYTFAPRASQPSTSASCGPPSEARARVGVDPTTMTIMTTAIIR